MTKVLVDTSFLLALFAPRDYQHEKAKRAYQLLRQRKYIVAPVLPEAFYMIKEHVNYIVAMQAMTEIRSGNFAIIDLLSEDYVRMNDVMNKYADSEFDFADVAQMVIAERFDIPVIFSFDKDFTRYVPEFKSLKQKSIRVLP